VESDGWGVRHFAPAESKGSPEWRNLSNNLQLLQCLQLPSDLPTGRSYVLWKASVQVSSFMARVLNRQVTDVECRVAHK
jgi:hypothetical protein